MRILLIDDNPFDRELVERLLRRALPEADLTLLGTAQELSHALEAGEPDVVVTDYNLQWGDGLEVLAEVKKRYPYCPVIMFTDSGSEELVVQAMRAGLSDYVLKRHLRTLPQVISHSLEEAQVRRERDRALEDLAESERRFRAISHLVSDYAYSFLFTQEGQPALTWMASSLPRRMGVSPEEMTEPGALLSLVHPEDRGAVDEQLGQLRAGKNVVFVHRFVARSGEVRWVRNYCSPRLDATGDRVIGGDGAAQDITEQKAAEEALQGQMARLALLNQVARAILERQDLASVFQVVLAHVETSLPVDAAWIAQVAGEELEIVGLTQTGSTFLSDCLRRGSSLRLCPEVREVLAQGQTVTLAEPATLRRLFGETELPPNCKTLVISPLMLDNTLAGALFAARGQGRGFLSSEAAFLRAVAEHLALAWRHAKLFESLEMAYHDLRQTQAALMQQERLRALGQMASGIAHDINNALSPVSLFSSIMLRDPELPERHRHAVEVILKAVDSAGQTLRRLKDFYRKTPEDAHVEPVNLAALVEEVVELTKPQWSAFPQQHGVLIQMETHIPKDLPPLLAVASELRDALTNLILNAVDALPTGGTISIRASLIGPPGAEDHVLLEVSDNGIGMDEETRARALEPFFTTKPTGTGMGLPTVFGAVQRLGGHVELDSAPGRGTTVRLLLPLRRLPPFQAPPAEAVTLPPLRILFVDDEPLIREALGHALEQEGHHITCCQSAEEGLEAFTQALGRDEAFDVVITDLGMPGMSGRELAAKIKGLSPTTPVVLLSGWGTTLGERGPNQVDAVLSKPASITAVCSTLARLYHAKGQQEP